MQRWLLAILMVGCADLESETPGIAPVVTITGSHAVIVNQSLALTAATQNGSDTSYAWASDNTAIATVSEEGVVTAHAAGEASITATGSDTKAQANHAIVVIALAADANSPQAILWQGSPHADTGAEAFNHWNEDGAVPTSCARCHSSEGFIDYLGGDETAPGTIEAPAPIQSVVGCETCHHNAAQALTSVTFPSGATVNNLGPEARCMTCHQGRASGLDVDQAVAQADVTDDEASSDLGFLNVHYYPAAATLYAGVAQGGYQYEGMVYDVRFRHAPGFDTCVGCHDPHSTKVRINACQGCHTDVTDAESLRNIRMIASRNQDYDGDANTTEGMYYELQGLREKLLLGIQRYGAERALRLCYANSYPYWFNDTDGDNTCSTAEAQFSNGYASWTPRLLRAAYNYQLAHNDPGSFAHNAKYSVQLLHDSIVDLNGGLVVPQNTQALVRNDVGHFDGASQAARNWDADEEISASCSRCHGGAPGYHFFVQYGVGQQVPETPNGLECVTCHDTLGANPTVAQVSKTWLPDGSTASLPGDDNLCANCHIGRESKATLDARTSPAFVNVHYLPSAGVREGSLLHTGYEYESHTYAGRLAHPGGNQCTSCHNPAASNHTFAIADVWQTRCDVCHADQNQAEEIRPALTRQSDYDGDGNTNETLRSELDGMAVKVLQAMRTASGLKLCYDGHTYPYFFKDNDDNKVCSPEEAVRANQLTGWTTGMMRAAHNFQILQKDPGAYAHNFNYIAQLLFDSIEDLGGSTAGMTRP